MLAIPPYFLLAAFGLFLAGFLFFSIANIILLARFGARNIVGLLITFVFIAGTAAILYFTWLSLAGLDWKTPVELISFEIPNF